MSVQEQDPPQISDPRQKSNEAIATVMNQAMEGVEAGDEGSANDNGQDWLTIARETYRVSTSFVDANYRKRWEDSIRAHNSQHSQDSKYVTPAYSKRSNIYRPKLRSVTRKNEAAAASAFFSNVEIIDIQAQNQDDPQQRASAEINKHLLQYRLENSIKWFHICMGGLQDVQKMGAVCGWVHWEFEQDHRGNVRKDKPTVDLIPLENFRWDPAASWMDPVATSPYIIHLMPMYVCDVKEKMRNPDPKTGRPEWRAATEEMLRTAQQSIDDSTRMTREKQREDPYDTANRPVQDYSIVWIQRHIHRRGGVDWEFYTLADQALLTDPQPLQVSTWHGQRDYVVGCFILETHTSMAPSVAELGKPLFDEINEVTNQRLDNVKFVLNKKWIVRRNRNVDTAGLVRNVPGGVVSADDPEGDIRELTWPDVTQSSFQEQGLLNAEADELLGNFNAVNLPRTGQLADTVHGAQLLTAPSSMLTEYGLRTYVETFVLPVMKLLVKLEQNYETDDKLLALVGQKARLFQKYGISTITDELLNQSLTVRVNVGMGATDPASKLQKFVIGLNAFVNILKSIPPGVMNVQEIAKEIFGHLGYQDGTRFMTNDNPAVQDLQMKLMQAMQFIQKLGKELNDRTQDNQTKIEIGRLQKEGRENVAKIAHDKGGVDHEHILKAHEIALRHEGDIQKIVAEAQKFILETLTKIQLEREKMALDREKHQTQMKMLASKHQPQKDDKPRNKKITIKKGDDGSYSGNIEYQ